MRKAYKFKLFKNRAGDNKLKEELYVFSEIYNHSLALIKRHYGIFGRNPSKGNLDKHLKRLRDRGLRPRWKELGYSQGVQNVLERIYKSYDAFFEWAKKKGGARKSPPKFKPFRKYKSFTLVQSRWKVNEEKGIVTIGDNDYRYNNSRRIEGKIKTLTVKRDSVGDWFIIFSCDLGEDYKPDKIKPMTGKSAGFDFGLTCFLTSSDDERIKSPEFLKQSLQELRKRCRNLSKKKKGSKNRSKAKKQLARLHRKVANQRRDFLFKLANRLITEYDVLHFEDLNLEGMKRLWGRKVSDHGLCELMEILKFKTKEHGKVLHQVGRFFPSSKTCSKCSTVKKHLELKERVFECESCGHKADRDLNAAMNILSGGASSVGGDEVRLAS